MLLIPIAGKYACGKGCGHIFWRRRASFPEFITLQRVFAKTWIDALKTRQSIELRTMKAWPHYRFFRNMATC